MELYYCTPILILDYQVKSFNRYWSAAFVYCTSFRLNANGGKGKPDIEVILYKRVRDCIRNYMDDTVSIHYISVTFPIGFFAEMSRNGKMMSY